MTNDQLFEGAEKLDLLMWVRAQSFNPCGATDDELNCLVNAWIKERDYRRNQAISAAKS